jgi:hypothetical protein
MMNTHKQTMIIEFDAMHYSLVSRINKVITDFIAEQELVSEGTTFVDVTSSIDPF